MRRTRLVFLSIISFAVVLILGGLLIQLVGDLLDRDSDVDSVPTSLTSDGDAVTEGEPAPVRADSVLVTIASSNTERNWLDQVVAGFNQAEFQTATGNAIFAEVEHVTSGGSMNAILDGALTPVVWSPGDPSWVAQMNETWEQRHNRPINSQDCPQVRGS